MNKSMISLIAGGILFVCASYVGIMIRRHYKKRRDFFRDLVDFIDILDNEISYLKTPLKEIIAAFCDEKKGEFKTTLLAYVKLIDEGKTINVKTLQAALPLGFLKTAEKDTVTGFFAVLGKTDAKTQLLNLKNYKSKFELIRDDADKKFKTNGMLAYKLGVLLGIAVMIFVA